MSSDNHARRKPGEIELALEHNRDRIDNTLDKLQAKFSPGALFDQAWRYAREKSDDGTTTRLKDTLVRNPVPAALVGVGIAWLLVAGQEGSVPSRKSEASPIEPGEQDRATAAASTQTIPSTPQSSRDGDRPQAQPASTLSSSPAAAREPLPAGASAPRPGARGRPVADASTPPVGTGQAAGSSSHEKRRPE